MRFLARGDAHSYFIFAPRAKRFTAIRRFLRQNALFMHAIFRLMTDEARRDEAAYADARAAYDARRA